ncbi:MAG: nucleotidyltransferase family protein [Candidatus Aenigmarchaeota archaeon]|nr:nucleotidyltransferase family protein [Candidatus Aenigmarchaeota archaeon]
MNMKRIKSVISQSKPELKKKYKVKEIGIFGSYARGEQKKTSDLDILIRFDKDASLFDFVELGNFLEEKLKVKIDIVSEGGVRKELKNAIMKEVVMV